MDQMVSFILYLYILKEKHSCRINFGEHTTAIIMTFEYYFTSCNRAWELRMYKVTESWIQVSELILDNFAYYWWRRFDEVVHTYMKFTTVILPMWIHRSVTWNKRCTNRRERPHAVLVLLFCIGNPNPFLQSRSEKRKRKGKCCVSKPLSTIKAQYTLSGAV